MKDEVRKLFGRLPALLVLLVMVGGIAVLVSSITGNSNDSEIPTELVVPVMSADGEKGRLVFNKSCAVCHGQDAMGGDMGPPLVHPIYNPGHHSDTAFFMAAKNGTRQHHWRFGDMPAQPNVSENDMLMIVRFVRETQEANGIFYQQHNMQ